MRKKKRKGKVNRTRALQQDLSEGSIPRFIYDLLCKRPHTLKEIHQRSERRFKGLTSELHLRTNVTMCLESLVDYEAVQKDGGTGRYEIDRPVEGFSQPKPIEAQAKASGDSPDEWRWDGLPARLVRLAEALDGKGKLKASDVTKMCKEDPSRIHKDFKNSNRWEKWIKQYIGRDPPYWWLNASP